MYNDFEICQGEFLLCTKHCLIRGTVVIEHILGVTSCVSNVYYIILCNRFIILWSKVIWLADRCPPMDMGTICTV